ncbi:GDP-perosamine synthase [Pandoraea aquatica]|uniref:GDP-perosamine synthase n=1 Tax=Pandoraea aquatica TaxID=2508290 RepID=A0A5E4YNT6_9BURK|nr:LegC family aminotransferase [Pandoraea aquatica]VVE49593.1 GDP-perosamine synthase [Pandoraea aquatica]
MSDVKARYLPLIQAVRERFPGDGFVPLHAPVFGGNEKTYLSECIDSTFVSSVGPFVDRFERMMEEITGSKFAIATMNGTAALHMTLILAGVRDGDEVITQPLTFVATCNAIAYQRAHPIFLDVDRDTLGLSPDAVADFLESHAEMRDGQCFNRGTGRRIRAMVPMHTFGIASRIEKLIEIGERWNIVVIEDAAEAIGSTWKGKALGTFAPLSAFSFNGNKIVTSGGGGCVVTDSPEIARLAKHLTTTAKSPHAWEFSHDQVGYNYRLPNINAALACAQLEQLPGFLAKKRELSRFYADVCQKAGLNFLNEPVGGESNFWLNAVLTEGRDERDALLAYAADEKIMMRPVWQLMTTLPAFRDAQAMAIPNAQWLQDRIVNIPSSVPAQ